MTEIIVYAWLLVLSCYSLLARWENKELAKRVTTLNKRISSLKGVTTHAGRPEDSNFHAHTVLIFDGVYDEEA